MVSNSHKPLQWVMGANDLPMIKTAGIGIAFCTKPIVREQAPYQIPEPDLYKVIEILDEVKEIVDI